MALYMRWVFLRKKLKYLPYISNTLLDDNFYDAIIATPSIVLKYNQLQGIIRMQSRHISKGSLKSAKELSQKWYIWIDTANAAIRATTQNVIWKLIHPLNYRYRRKQKQFYIMSWILTFNLILWWRGPAQDAPFFYTSSHLSELKSCKSIISTNLPLIWIFK